MTYPTYPTHLARARRRRLRAYMVLDDGLRYFATYIPGGVHNLITLARLSKDEKVRQLAVLWNSLPRKDHRTVNLDRLCLLDAEVSPGMVLASIAETAYDLDIDVSELIGAIDAIPNAAREESRRARTGSWRDRERCFRRDDLVRGPNTASAADPDSELEPIEKETMEFTRMLKRGLQRERRQQGVR